MCSYLCRWTYIYRNLWRRSNTVNAWWFDKSEHSWPYTITIWAFPYYVIYNNIPDNMWVSYAPSYNHTSVSALNPYTENSISQSASCILQLGMGLSQFMLQHSVKTRAHIFYLILTLCTKNVPSILSYTYSAPPISPPSQGHDVSPDPVRYRTEVNLYRCWYVRTIYSKRYVFEVVRSLHCSYADVNAHPFRRVGEVFQLFYNCK